MRVFISCDIEGTAGIANWDETSPTKDAALYQYFREQMTREVASACTGAREAGASTIHIKDAHDSGRNIIPLDLPRGVLIHRGWSGFLGSMADMLGGGREIPTAAPLTSVPKYDAFACVGYHSPAFSAGNPLAHTMNGTISEIRINDVIASEFMIHSLYSARLGIPIIFLSGDADLCNSSKELIPNLTIAPVSSGRGNASISLHPLDAADLIRERMRSAVEGYVSSPTSCKLELPDSFTVTIRYTTNGRAISASEYPGVRLLDSRTVSLTANDFIDIMRAFHFIL